ncbi:ejaculatory bulb-specific protein 3-like [Macrosteles quadrilineatus]|uniref:ejaculatory bulb-specific protein 3-like n=1 Tax=Macrosteles quadrilineatus TaxID=74068 RepID=UPI0023E2866A|nr:ejaculatory bulb-specific protein 3-like [Macrosteles quadrilineatus]
MIMKVLTILLITVAAAAAADTYVSTWDNIDLDGILSNDRLLKAYVDCLVGRGKCTPDAAALKRILPEAIQTHCAKCTEKQKKGGIKAIKFMMEKKPELWKEIGAKYDPTGEHTKNLRN